MSYLALYRKYRPTKFDEVIDQEHITKTLINQIENDKVGHAYLFCGSRGTGKTSTAKIFARAINCEHPVNGSACGECKACKSLSESNNLDILEIDAASNNGVDEIRELREQVKYPPVNGKYKVYIIDEVHMLSPSAFNALLKTLEEPPKYVVFILATTESHKIPATILSRCMRFDFKLVSTEAIAELLKRILTDSKISFDEKAVNIIARAGNGSVRDALSIADMVIAYSNNNLTYDSVAKVVGSIEKDKLYDIIESLTQKSLGKMLEELDKILGTGKPPQVLSKEIITYLRDLLVIHTVSEPMAKEMVVVPTDTFLKMKGQASDENYKTILSAIECLSTVEQDLRYSVHPRIVLETSLIKAMNFINLEQRVTNIEKKLQGVNLEVKKKITEIKVFNNELKTSSKVNIVGELMAYLRRTGNMLTYAGVAVADKIELEENKLTIVATAGTKSESLNNAESKKILQEFCDSFGYELNFVYNEDPMEVMVKKLKDAFGEYIKITE